jgi:tRNA nucleotidyltransferase (CCA-adding enzyme)
LGDAACQEGARLYLVGGAVRDRLLGFETLDIDLSCEGEVKKLGDRLGSELGVKFTYFEEFQTGTLEGPQGARIDIARARTETYPRPGKLPVVKPASIEEDLHRRDFTINSLAQSLHPDSFGKLIDVAGGKRDIELGLVRVLHVRSFIDDPTRIFRAVRYAKRLGFRIEPTTNHLLKETLDLIPRLSGERLLYELRCIMRERGQVRLSIVRKLYAIGALGFLGAKVKPISYAKLARIKTEESCEFLCLLFSHFTQERIKRLPVSKRCLDTIRTVGERSGILSGISGLTRPSSITFFLNNFDRRGLRIIAETELSRSSNKLVDYLEIFSKVRVKSTGHDLKKMGLKQGPQYSELMNKLLAARLDGKAGSKREETALLRNWIKGN